ncbi:MAG: GNAT family N-acetyltransferase [Pyrinomonadaceae bacterium]
METSALKIETSHQAESTIKQDAFKQEWNRLFAACPWATVFQDFRYLAIWVDNYSDQFELILVSERDKSENLIGLLPLARERATGRLIVAGDHHAEYKTWLATPENGNAFPEKAFRLLARKFPKADLDFTFLAPGTPLEWLKNGWKHRSRLQSVPRSMVSLGEENTSDASLRKRGNKTRIRQLERMGELKLLEIETPEEFEAAFDRAENLSHLRLSAIHGVQVERDVQRKNFHLDLFNKTDLIYATRLDAGAETAAIKICFKNRNEMLLCITAMSPFFSKQSPSKLHLLMLGKHLTGSNYKSLDLSPGSGYKERFSNEIDSIHTLRLFFNRTKSAKFNLKREAACNCKRALETTQTPLGSAYDLMIRFKKKVSKLNASSLYHGILNRSFRRIYSKKECRIYSIDVENISNAEPIMKVNSIDDLLKYRAVELSRETRSQFHQKVLKNFEEGTRSYTLADEKDLLHYGWLKPRQTISQVFEVNQEYEMPEGSAVLFDFYTHPRARGKGIYRRSLKQLLAEAKAIPGTKRVYIGAMKHNRVSRHVIESVGFEHELSLFKQTFLGFEKKWRSYNQIEPNNADKHKSSQKLNAAVAHAIYNKKPSAGKFANEKPVKG